MVIVDIGFVCVDYVASRFPQLTDLPQIPNSAEDDITSLHQQLMVSLAFPVGKSQLPHVLSQDTLAARVANVLLHCCLNVTECW